MMLALLLCFLCAEPAPDTLPDNFRAYFQRVDSVRAATVHDLETQLTDREIDLRSAPILRTQNVLKREISRLEKQLAEVKKQKPFAFIPNPKIAKAGDIGILRPGEVSRAVDDMTAVVFVHMKYSDATTSGSFSYVVTSIESKPLKTGKPYSSSDLWRVVSTTTTDGALLRQVIGEYAIVAPVPKGDVARYEALYLAEKAALLAKQSNDHKAVTAWLTANISGDWKEMDWFPPVSLDAERTTKLAAMDRTIARNQKVSNLAELQRKRDAFASQPVRRICGVTIKLDSNLTERKLFDVTGELKPLPESADDWKLLKRADPD